VFPFREWRLHNSLERSSVSFNRGITIPQFFRGDPGEEQIQAKSKIPPLRSG
jgi:hypothetical protein